MNKIATRAKKQNKNKQKTNFKWQPHLYHGPIWIKIDRHVANVCLYQNSKKGFVLMNKMATTAKSRNIFKWQLLLNSLAKFEQSW